MAVYTMSWLPDAVAAVATLFTALLSTQYDVRSASHRTAERGIEISGGTRGLALTLGGCGKQCGASTAAPPSKIFWTLQEDIVRGFQSILRLARDNVRVPETLVDPPPLFVFAGWMLVALTLSIALEISDGRRNHTIFLSSGILVGIILGIAECAPLSSVLLTNLPWSLAVALGCSTVYPRRMTVHRYPRNEKD